jgi:hypothetical protein
MHAGRRSSRPGHASTVSPEAVEALRDVMNDQDAPHASRSPPREWCSTWRCRLLTRRRSRNASLHLRSGRCARSLEMGSLEDRLRKLEERLIRQPSVDEYLDASNRERTRALHALAERLEKYGFEGDYLFTEDSLRMLGEDTTGLREREREIVEAWYRAQGRDRAAEVEGAKEKLLAKLGVRF